MGEDHAYHFWPKNDWSIQTLAKAVSDSLLKAYLNVCGLLLTNSLINKNEEELLSNVHSKHCIRLVTHMQMLSKRSFNELKDSFTAEFIWICCIWIILFWLA